MTAIRHGWVVVGALAACDEAAEPEPYRPPDNAEVCNLREQRVRCVGTSASTFLGWHRHTQTSHLRCTKTDDAWQHVCTAGCAVQSEIHVMAPTPGAITVDSWMYQVAPVSHVLCAEIPDAQPGDVCSDTRPCLPTRVRLNADGTVASQRYLTCQNGTCIDPVAAPIIDWFLGRCSISLAPYATPGTRGVVTVSGSARAACLVAYDEATQTVASGVTSRCFGDWECPVFTLCDDQMPVLTDTMEAIAVCKPGPRGTLDPAWLAH